MSASTDRDELDITEFTASQHFRSVNFVLKSKRRLPLPQLQQLLTKNDESIRTELVELINTKYSDFVGLSTRMKDLERLTTPLVEPLRERVTRSDSFAENLTTICDKARTTIHRRKLVAERKQMILSLQDHSRQLGKARDSLLKLQGKSGNSSSDDNVGKKHLSITKGPQVVDSVTGVVEMGTNSKKDSTSPSDHGQQNQSQGQQDHASNFFVTTDEVLKSHQTLVTIASRIAKARRFVELQMSDSGADSEIRDILSRLSGSVEEFRIELLHKLKDSLRSVFLNLLSQQQQQQQNQIQTQSQNNDSESQLGSGPPLALGPTELDRMSIENLTEAFVNLKAENDCEQLFYETLVAPCLAEASSKIQGNSVNHYFSTVSKGLFGDRGTFRFINNDNQVSVRETDEDLTLLSWIAKTSKSPCYLIARGIGQVILDFLIAKCNNIFIPTGILDTFAANYVSYCQFMRGELENAMIKQSERRYWQREIEIIVQKKWQCQVYYSIREKELTYHFSEFLSENKGVLNGQKLEALVKILQQYNQNVNPNQSNGKNIKPLLPVSEGLLRHCLQIWLTDTICLEGLFAKFLGLTLKIINNWLDEVTKHFMASMGQMKQAQAAQAASNVTGQNPSLNSMNNVNDISHYGLFLIADLHTLARHIDFASELRIAIGESNPMIRIPSRFSPDLVSITASAVPVQGVNSSSTQAQPQLTTTLAAAILYHGLKTLRRTTMTQILNSSHRTSFGNTNDSSDSTIRSISLKNAIGNTNKSLNDSSNSTAVQVASDGNSQTVSNTTDTEQHFLDVLSQTFQDTHESIGQSVDRLSDTVLGGTMEKIRAVIVEEVKRVPSLYRLMNKPMPTQSCAYIQTLLSPLDDILSRATVIFGNSSSSESEIKKAWTQRTACDAAQTLQQQTGLIVDQVEASYRSLQRVASSLLSGPGSNSGSGGPGGESQQHSDQDLIFRQLFLDMEAFTQICKEKYGVDGIVLKVEKLEHVREKIQNQN